jgi:DNA-binding transcriptional LysR family regulator
MADRGPPFQALRALEAACRLRSYSLAGAELGVTHSAVSQAVRRLEREYGRVLFRRVGLRMTPSSAALALAQAYREAVVRLASATGDLQDDAA